MTKKTIFVYSTRAFIHDIPDFSLKEVMIDTKHNIAWLGFGYSMNKGTIETLKNVCKVQEAK